MNIRTTIYGDISYSDDDGRLHRMDGPAIIRMDGYMSWYRNGKRHNENGPAIVWNNLREWFINGVEYSEQDFKIFHRKKIINKVLNG